MISYQHETYQLPFWFSVCIFSSNVGVCVQIAQYTKPCSCWTPPFRGFMLLVSPKKATTWRSQTFTNAQVRVHVPSSKNTQTNRIIKRHHLFNHNESCICLCVKRTLISVFVIFLVYQRWWVCPPSPESVVCQTGLGLRSWFCWFTAVTMLPHRLSGQWFQAFGNGGWTTGPLVKDLLASKKQY